MTSVQGGKSVYGASVGILMLETRFPRIAGDVGNAATWPFPVLYRVVRGASPDRVVRRGADGLLDAFVEAGRELVRAGAEGLTTSCGFLALHQADLARACGVPVAASSLMQAPAVEALLPPGRRAGILTVSRASLTARHLALAGVPPDAPVAGTDGGAEFTRVILTTNRRSTWTSPAGTWWTRCGGSSKTTPRWGPSCSNARTCARTPPTRRRRPDSRSTIS